MDPARLLHLFAAVTVEVRRAVDRLHDGGDAGERAGQYRLDLAADAVALPLLLDAGVGVLSEESGAHDLHRDVVVVMDPVDGSTNAAHGLPYYATSLCAVDGDGPSVAMVTNLATGRRYAAVRGEGLTVDGRPVSSSGVATLGEAIVAFNDLPPAHLGWAQYRALGAAALELAMVADGSLDAYADCSLGGLYPWDYLGGLLLCREAGVAVVDLGGEDLVVVDPHARRRPIAGSAPLVDELVARLRS